MAALAADCPLPAAMDEKEDISPPLGASAAPKRPLSGEQPDLDGSKRQLLEAGQARALLGTLPQPIQELGQVSDARQIEIAIAAQTPVEGSGAYASG